VIPVFVVAVVVVTVVVGVVVDVVVIVVVVVVVVIILWAVVVDVVYIPMLHRGHIVNLVHVAHCLVKCGNYNSRRADQQAEYRSSTRNAPYRGSRDQCDAINYNIDNHECELLHIGDDLLIQIIDGQQFVKYTLVGDNRDAVELTRDNLDSSVNQHWVFQGDNWKVADSDFRNIEECMEWFVYSLPLGLK